MMEYAKNAEDARGLAKRKGSRHSHEMKGA